MRVPRLSTIWEEPEQTIKTVRKVELLSFLDVETIHDHVLPYLDITALKQLLFTCTSLCELVNSFLRVTKCILISDKTRRQFKEKQLLSLALKTSNLRYLDVSECSDALTNLTLRAFLNHNPHIRLLNISKCNRVNEGAFQIDTQTGPILAKLEVFIANWCRNLKHECLIALCHAPVRVLSIAGTWYTTDQGITDCITFFRDQLECLNVNKCYKVSDASFTQLTACPHLRIVKISNCWRISDLGVEVVMNGCHQIEQIVMDDCRSITKGMLLRVSERGLLLLEGCIGGAQELWDNSQHYLTHGFTF